LGRYERLAGAPIGTEIRPDLDLFVNVTSVAPTSHAPSPASTANHATTRSSFLAGASFPALVAHIVGRLGMLAPRALKIEGFRQPTLMRAPRDKLQDETIARKAEADR
jgi:hypothetical protein